MYTRTAAAAILLGAFISPSIAQQATCAPYGTDFIVEGNKTSTVCLWTLAQGQPASRKLSYQLFGSGTWKFDNNPSVTAPLSGGSLSTPFPAADGSHQYSLTTSGLPITGSTPSATNYGTFLFCYTAGTTNTCAGTQQLQVIRIRVDPIVRPSVNTITQDGATPVTVTLGAVGDNPTANAAVNASCTPATNGATVTVSPSSRTTAANGTTPNFTITTSNLTVYASSGNAPSSVCTFSTAAGSKSAVVNVQGRRLAPLVTVNPTFTQLPVGSTSYSQTLTVSTSNPPAVNAPINVTCEGFDSGNILPLSATLTTDAFGMAAHTMNVSNMVAINPAPPPTARCTFALGTIVNPPTSTIRGEQLTRHVSLNPASITAPGSTPIIASISHPFPGFAIQASCTSSRPDVPVSLSPNCINPNVPECKTGTAGTVAFTVSAPQLGFADPNTAATPNANCTFQLVPGGDVSTLTLPYTNVCTATTNPSPLPAACGNPL